MVSDLSSYEYHHASVLAAAQGNITAAKIRRTMKYYTVISTKTQVYKTMGNLKIAPKMLQQQRNRLKRRKEKRHEEYYGKRNSHAALQENLMNST